MPYITKRDRKKFEKIIAELSTKFTDCPVGELNYLLTSICMMYMSANGYNYSHYNDVVGALECAKLEIYRRKIAAYEDTKIETNGDVFL